MDFTLKITGTAPLLTHNGRLSDPLDEAAKRLKVATAKRGKTDDDQELLSHLEWLGGMYYDPEVGPFIPGDNVWRSLLDAAKKTKDGVKVKEGVFITSDVNPLGYGGTRDLDAMWRSGNFVHRKSAKVGMQRIIRTRPYFRQWSIVADGILDEAILDFEALQRIAETAGALIGLGDWRPRYGRFSAEVTR